MAALVLFNSFGENVAEKKIDLSGTLKLALSLVAPSAANTQLSDITQIDPGAGYTTGGLALTVVSSSQTGGLYKLVLAVRQLVSTSGGVSDWRYATVYDDGSTGDLLIGYIDSGGTQTMSDGDIYTWTFDQVDGVLQAALS